VYKRQAVTNPFIQGNGTATPDTVYYNSLFDMRRFVTGQIGDPTIAALYGDLYANSLGYADQSTLPTWMSSNQPDITTGKFMPPLGLVNAVVLAYVKPNPDTSLPPLYNSNKIAYRVRTSGINFNDISFVADRYQLDNTLSTYVEPTGNTFVSGRETSFDIVPVIVGTYEGTVDYAIEGLAFNQINGRSIDYVNALGGLDNITTFQDGQTVIFKQQENFIGADVGRNDGWVKYTGGFIGDTIDTLVVEGYDTGPYDGYYLVPGYNEKIDGVAVTATVTDTIISNGNVALVPCDLVTSEVSNYAVTVLGIIPEHASILSVSVNRTTNTTRITLDMPINGTLSAGTKLAFYLPESAADIIYATVATTAVSYTHLRAHETG
jgi:hypothetical protein